MSSDRGFELMDDENKDVIVEEFDEEEHLEWLKYQDFISRKS